MRRHFGTVRKLPSGRWQARYSAPDGRQHSAATTFQTKADASAWLATVQADQIRGVLPAPRKTASKTTLTDYAVRWLEDRELKPSSRAQYDRLLHKVILPDLGKLPLRSITADDVKAWHARLAGTGPSQRAQAYQILSTIMASAVDDGMIPASPCRIRGAGSVPRAKTIRPATLPELETITAMMPERLRLLVLLSAWCALRFGESTELRRRDVDLEQGVLRIRRGVSRARGEYVVGTPKSAAGVRDVAVPPHLLPMLADHLEQHAQPGRDGLLFPAAGGGHLSPSSVYVHFYPARHRAGRDDLRWHDLRHTGAVLAAATGATLAELMARLGHSSPRMALRYQHASADRDRAIAEALSRMAEK